MESKTNWTDLINRAALEYYKETVKVDLMYLENPIDFKKVKQAKRGCVEILKNYASLAQGSEYFEFAHEVSKYRQAVRVHPGDESLFVKFCLAEYAWDDFLHQAELKAYVLGVKLYDDLPAGGKQAFPKPEA